jgi:hypothetical protein
MTTMMAIRMRRKRIPLTEPNSIAQLLKAARKGHIVLPDSNRLAKARHRRGARGHEGKGFAQ